jgi:hypothetical protein
MHAVTHNPTPMVVAARRRLTIRIATVSAIAALSIGGSAATASAHPCSCDGDAAQDTQVAQAWIQAQRQLPRVTASPSKRDKRPLHVRYLGRH